MTLDRWGDSTHKMAAYNHRHKPTFRDQRQIDRMDAETMVMYPVSMPDPVLPTTLAPGHAGRNLYPQEVRPSNWRAEGLRNPNPGFQDFPAAVQDPQSTAGYYRRLPTPGPYGRARRRGSRKSPSRRPHKRVYYPPSPQYKPHSSSENEAGPTQRRRGKMTDPNPTPRPRDSDEDLAEDNQGFTTPPEGVEGPLSTQQSHTALCKELDKALDEVLGPQGTDQAMETEPTEDPQPSTSRGKRQGGGDRDPTPGPQGSRQLNFATERWFMEPNKVEFFDRPDTYFANVGRHREREPRLMRAKTFPHLVFADPPASPDRDEEQNSRQRESSQQPPRGGLQGHP